MKRKHRYFFGDDLVKAIDSIMDDKVEPSRQQVNIIKTLKRTIKKGQEIIIIERSDTCT